MVANFSHVSRFGLLLIFWVSFGSLIKMGSFLWRLICFSLSLLFFMPKEKILINKERVLGIWTVRQGNRPSVDTLLNGKMDGVPLLLSGFFFRSKGNVWFSRGRLNVGRGRRKKNSFDLLIYIHSNTSTPMMLIRMLDSFLSRGRPCMHA